MKQVSHGNFSRSELSDDPSLTGLDADAGALTSDRPSLEGLEEFAIPDKSALRPVQARMQPGTPLLPFGGASSQAAEQYRIIRTRIVQHPLRPRAIAVSSAAAGDGKSVNTVNLAGVMALNPEFEVLLLDGDLHRSGLAQYLGISSSPGLADVLAGEATLADCVVRVEPYPNLFFLPGGKGARGPADLLNSKRWDDLATAVRAQFTYIFADTPPTGALADFDLIRAAFDGVVLVVRQDHTNRGLWRRAYESVPPAKLIGVVVNCVKPWFLGRGLGYYAQYYQYSRYYQQGE